ncbi:MAG: nucleotidyltransferase domain-containing protein [Geobacter sp.]|nr:MAG: nucleotidyltransferase domain-containing protein [Geobacter sp.]
MNARFGLKQSTIDKINGVFSAHPRIERVIIYGSRAKGNYRNSSDIDITIEGEAITLSELLKVETELDDLLLPYTLDLSLLHLIDDQDLLNHIRRVGSVFYERQAISADSGDNLTGNS